MTVATIILLVVLATASVIVNVRLRYGGRRRDSPEPDAGADEEPGDYGRTG